MLDLLSADSDLTDGGVDCSNYGCFEGIPSARALARSFGRRSVPDARAR
ncbi:MAG: hypothetical protein ACLTSX_09680 [Collinsella sp.]